MSGFYVSLVVCQAKVPAADRSGTSDPYVQVELKGAQPKKASSKVASRTLNPVWNARFDWTFDNEKSRPTAAVLKVMDHDHFSRDDFLGKVEIDLSAKWSSSEDAVYEWLPLQREGVEVGSLQIRIIAASSNVNEEFRYMQLTHVLRVDVKEGRQLIDKDLLGKGDPFVQLSFGSASARTTTAPNSNNPKWDQAAYFWVNQNDQENYKIRVQVFDDDRLKSDLIGEGYVQLAPLFGELDEKRDDAVADVWLPISKVTTADDSQLNQLIVQARTGDVTLSVDESQLAGSIHLTLTLTAKPTMERRFFAAAIDAVNEGESEDKRALSKADLAWILHTSGLGIEADELDRLFPSLDANGNGTIEEDEVFRLLTSQAVLRGGAKLLRLLLTGEHSIEQSLMDVVEGEKYGELLIKDLATGLFVTEHVPSYIKAGIKAMSCSGVSRKFVAKSRDVMIKASQRMGDKYNKPESVREIPHFIALHKLDVSDIEKPIEEYATFNEFFARRLKPTARPIAEENNPLVVVSPADCRMTAFATIEQAQDIWIKGSQFTVERLLGPLAGEYGARFTSGSLAIARLAPQDYHCWHIPVTGTILQEHLIDGALYTVNPIAVNNDVNVYTENKRCLVPIETQEYGTVMLVIIGALMVGSINLELKAGTQVQKGTRHGAFKFGGSTVLVLFEPRKVEFDERILNNTREKIETLVRVGTAIGKALPKGAVPRRTTVHGSSTHHGTKALATEPKAAGAGDTKARGCCNVL